jgi:uncharacterized phage protein gp47/JayE
MSFGITDSGFETKRLDDIKTEIEDSLKSELGAGINLTPQSPLGQIVGIMAERFALLWELGEEIYNAPYPESSFGTSLDDSASIVGVTRLPATYSTVTVRVFGANGTAVPLGFVVSVSGNPNARFESTVADTIGVSGYVDIPFQAEDTGAIEAPAGSLTVIETPVAGVDSTNNTLDADVGRDIETDQELKTRRQERLQRAGTATVEGIRNNIAQVENVESVTVVENTDIVPDSEGRPGKSFESIVLGGDEDEIAESIWEAKPAGIETDGDITKSMTDSQGLAHDIKFSRPTEKDIWMIINITPNADPNEGALYPADGDNLVEEVVLEYGATFQLGQDVVTSRFYTPINTVPGVIGIEVLVGFSSPPTSSANLPIGPGELAKFDSTRTTVNS